MTPEELKNAFKTLKENTEITKESLEEEIKEIEKLKEECLLSVKDSREDKAFKIIFYNKGIADIKKYIQENFTIQ